MKSFSIIDCTRLSERTRAYALSHNDRFLVSGSLDSKAGIWELENGKLLQVLEGMKMQLVLSIYPPMINMLLRQEIVILYHYGI